MSFSPFRSTAKVTAMTAHGRQSALTDRNKTVVLDYAAPGDILQIEASRTNKDLLEGRILEITHKGQGRITPKCPLHFVPGKQFWCGGCNLGHLSYDAQLRAKADIARCALASERSIAGVRLEPVVRSPQEWRYRNKLQVPFCAAAGKVHAGFYHPASHKVMDFSDCPVQSEPAVKITAAVKQMAARNRWSIYNEDKHSGWLRHLLIRTTSDGKAMVVFVARGEPQFDLGRSAETLAGMFPQIRSVYLNIQPEVTAVILGRKWRKLLGDSTLEETVCGVRLMFYPGSFLQVNTPATELLYRIAVSFLRYGDRTPELYDIYSGVGAIGLIAAKEFESVTGIEENEGATACAWKNAERNKIKNARFLAGKAEVVFSKQVHRKSFKPAAVVLDPPRQGCARPLLSELRHPAVRKIVYVSCNPVSFARDAAFLSASGFALKKVQPVDLFPQTSHIELVGYFERGRSTQKFRAR